MTEEEAKKKLTVELERLSKSRRDYWSSSLDARHAVMVYAACSKENSCNACDGFNDCKYYRNVLSQVERLHDDKEELVEKAFDVVKAYNLVKLGGSVDERSKAHAVPRLRNFGGTAAPADAERKESSGDVTDYRPESSGSGGPVRFTDTAEADNARGK